MISDERPIIDWVNFPEGVPRLSLWHTLHDGDLTAIESDLFARTVTLRFDVDYVRKFHRFSEQTRFVIVVSGVQSVRSLYSVPWPGGCSIPPKTPYQQQQAIVAEYHRKCREDSQSWTDLERLAKDRLEVSDGTLGRGSDGIALHFGLLVGTGAYMDAYIRGEGVTFFIGEGQVTPEEFVAVGQAYWNEFAGRGK